MTIQKPAGDAKKCQVWITTKTRQRLRLMAALEGTQLMDQIALCVEATEKLKKIAETQGVSLEELIEQLVDSVKLPDEDQPRS